MCPSLKSPEWGWATEIHKKGCNQIPCFQKAVDFLSYSLNDNHWILQSKSDHAQKTGPWWCASAWPSRHLTNLTFAYELLSLHKNLLCGRTSVFLWGKYFVQWKEHWVRNDKSHITYLTPLPTSHMKPRQVISLKLEKIMPASLQHECVAGIIVSEGTPMVVRHDIIAGPCCSCC